MREEPARSEDRLRCLDCHTEMIGSVIAECALCSAYGSGQMALLEGMRFFVTAASVGHVQSWLDGKWIPSRILETHLAYHGARRSVAERNLPGNGRQSIRVTLIQSSSVPSLSSTGAS
jgi:hypothetical protein